MHELIAKDGVLLAIIVPRNFSEPGVHFFTPGELSQQLAYMRHPAGKSIGAHYHKPVPRQVLLTQEVLVVRKGRLQVDLYDEKQEFVTSRVLGAGDVILLAGGGHGFEVLEEVEMFEVKQGPYMGEGEKTRFDPSRNVESDGD